jgi:hypothetical protein
VSANAFQRRQNGRTAQFDRTLRGFLLDQAELTPEEHAHLVKCDECRREMVHAASKELERRRGRPDES